MSCCSTFLPAVYQQEVCASPEYLRTLNGSGWGYGGSVHHRLIQRGVGPRYPCCFFVGLSCLPPGRAIIVRIPEARPRTLTLSSYGGYVPFWIQPHGDSLKLTHIQLYGESSGVWAPVQIPGPPKMKLAHVSRQTEQCNRSRRLPPHHPRFVF